MINEVLDRHLYTNDSSEKLVEVKQEIIESDTLNADEILDYVIQKYKLEF